MLNEKCIFMRCSTSFRLLMYYILKLLYFLYRETRNKVTVLFELVNENTNNLNNEKQQCIREIKIHFSSKFSLFSPMQRCKHVVKFSTVDHSLARVTHFLYRINERFRTSKLL